MQDADLIRPGWREATHQLGDVALHVIEAGDPGDPLLLMLHGFPEFWWAWRNQITALSRAGYHVVAPDLRGYNLSSAPSGIASYRLDVLAADVVALADRYGAARFNLVGHDWGAAIAWWVAERYPGRLARLVVMDGPHPHVWAAQALKHPSQALRSFYIAVFQLPWVPEVVLGAFDFAALKATMQGSAHPDTFESGALDRYAQAWARPGAMTAMLNYYRALRRHPGGDSCGRIAPPTLILWGTEDRFLERHVMAAGLALCDDGRMVEIDGATHWLHLEQPERVTREILHFL